MTTPSSKAMVLTTPPSSKKRRHALPDVDSDGVLDLSKTFVGRNGLLETIAKISSCSKEGTNDDAMREEELKDTTRSVVTSPKIACRHLILSDHQITTELLHIILQSLDGNGTIEVLDLSANPMITFGGGRDLAVFARCNPTLVRVDLEGTSLGPAQVKAINDRLLLNAQMTPEERNEALEKFKQLKRNREEQQKKSIGKNHRLTVSNVRLLHSLATTPAKSSVDATKDDGSPGQMSSSPVINTSGTSRNIDMTSAGTSGPIASMIAETSSSPLHALGLLSAVIGGGYEELPEENSRNRKNNGKNIGGTSPRVRSPERKRLLARGQPVESESDDGSSIGEEDEGQM